MSATGESEKVAAVTAAKPVKEKKSKENKPKTASHPPYFEMIKEAVLALKEKGGSSPYAIGKYMEEKHKAVLPGNFRKMLGLQLKNSASKGKLIKIKASYKLSASAPKPKPLPPNKKKVKKADAAKGKATTTKVEAVKKTRAARATASTTTAKPKGKAVKKRAAPVKAKAKQPKSIKSPAAKKAKKAAA